LPITFIIANNAHKLTNCHSLLGLPPLRSEKTGRGDDAPKPLQSRRRRRRGGRQMGREYPPPYPNRESGGAS